MLSIHYFLEVGAFHHRVNSYFLVWAVASFRSSYILGQSNHQCKEMSLPLHSSPQSTQKTFGFVQSMIHRISYVTSWISDYFISDHEMSFHALIDILFIFFSFNKFVTDFSENRTHERNCLGNSIFILCKAENIKCISALTYKNPPTISA